MMLTHLCPSLRLKHHCHRADELTSRDSTETLLFLQRLPTHDWNTSHMRDLVQRGMELRREHVQLVASMKRDKAANPAVVREGAQVDDNAEDGDEGAEEH